MGADVPPLSQSRAGVVLTFSPSGWYEKLVASVASGLPSSARSTSNRAALILTSASPFVRLYSATRQAFSLFLDAASISLAPPIQYLEPGREGQARLADK
jgi:hypothetical protein